MWIDERICYWDLGWRQSIGHLATTATSIEEFAGTLRTKRYTLFGKKCELSPGNQYWMMPPEKMRIDFKDWLRECRSARTEFEFAFLCQCDLVDSHEAWTDGSQNLFNHLVAQIFLLGAIPYPTMRKRFNWYINPHLFDNWNLFQTLPPFLLWEEEGIGWFRTYAMREKAIDINET